MKKQPIGVHDMPVSVGGTITINIRDIATLGQSEEECRAFCTDVLGEECWQQVNAIRSLTAIGLSPDGMRAMASPDLAERDVSVGLTITGTF